MQQAYICGVGMTPFARYPQRSLKDLAREAVAAALADAGVAAADLQAAYCANSMAGLVTGQESIRGQVALNAMGITGIPVVNVENACASGSTAFHQACAMVSAGLCDVALALGVDPPPAGLTDWSNWSRSSRKLDLRNSSMMLRSMSLAALRLAWARVTGTGFAPFVRPAQGACQCFGA